MNLFRAVLLPTALAAAVAVPAISFAQQAPSAPPQQNAPGAYGQHHGHHGHGFMRAMRGINLSDQQKQQIQSLMSSYRQAHPEGSSRDPQAMKQLRDQVMNVLTPAQRTQFENNMKQMRQERREQNPNGTGYPQHPQASPTP